MIIQVFQSCQQAPDTVSKDRLSFRKTYPAEFEVQHLLYIAKHRKPVTWCCLAPMLDKFRRARLHLKVLRGQTRAVRPSDVETTAEWLFGFLFALPFQQPVPYMTIIMPPHRRSPLCECPSEGYPSSENGTSWPRIACSTSPGYWLARGRRGGRGSVGGDHWCSF